MEKFVFMYFWSICWVTCGIKTPGIISSMYQLSFNENPRMWAKTAKGKYIFHIYFSIFLFIHSFILCLPMELLVLSWALRLYLCVSTLRAKLNWSHILCMCAHTCPLKVTLIHLILRNVGQVWQLRVPQRNCHLFFIFISVWVNVMFIDITWHFLPSNLANLYLAEHHLLVWWVGYSQQMSDAVSEWCMLSLFIICFLHENQKKTSDISGVSL